MSKAEIAAYLLRVHAYLIGGGHPAMTWADRIGAASRGGGFSRIDMADAHSFRSNVAAELITDIDPRYLALPIEKKLDVAHFALGKKAYLAVSFARAVSNDYVISAEKIMDKTRASISVSKEVLRWYISSIRRDKIRECSDAV